MTFTIDAAASTVCSIAGSTVSFIGVGTCVINANQAGDANYNPAPQVQQSFPVGPEGADDQLHLDGARDATVGGPTYTVTATATSGLAGDLHDRRGGEHGVHDRGLDGLVHRRRDLRDQRQPGRATRNYKPGAAGAAVVRGGQAPAQTISFTSTAPRRDGGRADLQGDGDATSGLPVTFTIDAAASTVCTIAGSTVSFIGVGTCVINANQAGNATFNAAPQVQQSFTVGERRRRSASPRPPPVGATVAGPPTT